MRVDFDLVAIKDCTDSVAIFEEEISTRHCKFTKKKEKVQENRARFYINGSRIFNF